MDNEIIIMCDASLFALRDKAEAAGHCALVKACDAALDGDWEANKVCCAAVNDGSPLEID
jgi:hypothetical protein